MPKNNVDEQYILELAKAIPGVEARLAKPHEDGGHRKADVVLDYDHSTYYLQVSHTPKSKKAYRSLETRGTHSISTHKYEDQPYQRQELIARIKDILQNKP